MTKSLPHAATPHAITVLPSGDGLEGKIATCFFTCYSEPRSKKAAKAILAAKKSIPGVGDDSRGQVMSILAGLPGDTPCVETLRATVAGGESVVALALEATLAVGTGLAAVI